MLITSKSVGSAVLPGPTAAVKRLAHPDDAVLSVISTIAKADPNAQIVDVELDYFDRCVSIARRDERPPFCLCLPTILSRHPTTTRVPVSMFLASVPDMSNVPVSGEAMDVRNLRTGKLGDWSGPYDVGLEVLGEGGAVEVRPAQAAVCKDVVFRLVGRTSSGSAARVFYDRRDGMRHASVSRLVLVLGDHSDEAVAEAAAQTLSTGDDHPPSLRVHRSTCHGPAVPWRAEIATRAARRPSARERRARVDPARR